MTSRGNLIAGAVCALVILGAILVLVTGEDPPLEDTRLGETATSTTTTEPTTTTERDDRSSGTPDLDAVEVALDEVATFDQPIASGTRPGVDGLYVAERAGRIFLLDDGETGDPILDIAGETNPGGEQGLLGITFSPAGDRLYVHFTDNDGTSQVDEFVVADDGTIDGGSRRNLLSVEQPFGNHNGGHLAFGPDGLLYIALGDGGSGGDPEGNGQNPATLLGSILRIDPRESETADYTIPRDNPFADGETGAPEVFIYGLRNPWRFDFDDATGDLWIGDVGQNRFEEVSYLPAGEAQNGANLGWNVFEASSVFSEPAIEGTVMPIFEYGRDEGQSITGGVVYRGEAIADLVGAYVFADYFGGEIRAISLDPDSCADACLTPRVADERSLGLSVRNLAHFAEDNDGNIFVFSLDGAVSQLVAP